MLLGLRHNIESSTGNRSTSTTNSRPGRNRSAYIRFESYSKETICLHGANQDPLVENIEESTQGGLEDPHIEQPLSIQRSQAVHPAEAFTENCNSAYSAHNQAMHNVSIEGIITRFFCLVDYGCCASETFGIQHIKVVTDFFGGSKRQGKQISQWFILCPKHFRQLAHDGPTFQYVRLELVSRQLSLVEILFPGTRYTIRLLDCDFRRIQNDDHKALMYDANGRDKYGDPLPLSFLRSIQVYFCGSNKSMTQVLQLVDRLRSDLNGGVISEVPIIEFLAAVPKPCRQITSRSA